MGSLRGRRESVWENGCIFNERGTWSWEPPPSLESPCLQLESLNYGRTADTETEKNWAPVTTLATCRMPTHDAYQMLSKLSELW